MPHRRQQDIMIIRFFGDPKVKVLQKLRPGGMFALALAELHRAAAGAVVNGNELFCESRVLR